MSLIKKPLNFTFKFRYKSHIFTGTENYPTIGECIAGMKYVCGKLNGDLSKVPVRIDRIRKGDELEIVEIPGAIYLMDNIDFTQYVYHTTNLIPVKTKRIATFQEIHYTIDVNELSETMFFPPIPNIIGHFPDINKYFYQKDNGRYRLLTYLDIIDRLYQNLILTLSVGDMYQHVQKMSFNFNIYYLLFVNNGYSDDTSIAKDMKFYILPKNIHNHGYIC